MKYLFTLIGLVILMNVSAIDPPKSAPTMEDNYWKAMKLFNEENYAKSVLYFKAILDNDSTNAEINYYVGMCYHNLNKPKIANLYLSKAALDVAYRLKIQLLTRNNLDEVNYYSGY